MKLVVYIIYHSPACSELPADAVPRQVSVLACASQASHASSAASKRFSAYRESVNTAFEVSEAVLLRDMMFVLQGIDGKYIRYSKQLDCFVVDPQVCPPRILLTDQASLVAEAGPLKPASPGWVCRSACSARRVSCCTSSASLVGFLCGSRCNRPPVPF